MFWKNEMSVLNGHYSNIQQLRKWMQLSCSQRKGLATQSGGWGEISVSSVMNVEVGMSAWALTLY